MSWRQSKSGEVTFSKRVDLVEPQSFVFTPHWRHRKGVVAYDRPESGVRSPKSLVPASSSSESLCSHFRFHSHAHICPPDSEFSVLFLLFGCSHFRSSCPSHPPLIYAPQPCARVSFAVLLAITHCPFWLLTPRRLLCFTLATFVAPFCACPACPIMTTEIFHYPFEIRFVINLIYPQDIVYMAFPYISFVSLCSPILYRFQYIIGAQSHFWRRGREWTN